MPPPVRLNRAGWVCIAGPRVERCSIQYLQRIRRRQNIVVMRHANIAMASATASCRIDGPTRTSETRSAIKLDGVVRHQPATISGYDATAADCKCVT